MTNNQGVIYHVLNPFVNKEESSQDLYLLKYKECYFAFLNYFVFENMEEMFNDGVSYTFILDCFGENDIINNKDSYEYKFLKSKFFKNKKQKIVDFLSKYYKASNIFIENFYYMDNKIYMKLTKL